MISRDQIIEEFGYWGVPPSDYENSHLLEFRRWLENLGASSIEEVEAQERLEKLIEILDLDRS